MPRYHLLSVLPYSSDLNVIILCSGGYVVIFDKKGSRCGHLDDRGGEAREAMGKKLPPSTPVHTLVYLLLLYFSSNAWFPWMHWHILKNIVRVIS